MQNPTPSHAFRLFAPGDQFQLAHPRDESLPDTVAGQPATYFWKDVIAAGSYRHPTKGFSLAVDRKRLAKWADTGNRMLAAGLPIPINCDHSDAARDCVGYVKQFKLDANRLLALCQLIGEDAPLLAARNQVSAGIAPDFTDGQGQSWGDAIIHVALTPTPVVSGQEPFIQAASSEGQMVLELAAQPLEDDALATSLATARQELSRLTDLITQKDREILSLRQQSPPPPDPAAQEALLESFDLKLAIAISRGAIDKSTRDRLADLLGRNSAGEVNVLTLSRQPTGKPLALSIAEILMQNKPVPPGETTPLQTLSRQIPGEVDPTLLNHFTQYMTTIANRK